MSGNRLRSGIALLLGALAIGCASAAAAAPAAADPPVKLPPVEQPPKHGGGVSVGIAYRHGSLVLSSDKAGRAQILIRSADGRRHWLKAVRLQTPTTTLRLKTLFPKITPGRYRVVVRPLFAGGFLSGAWITVL
jgi:hypothetical protein